MVTRFTQKSSGERFRTGIWEGYWTTAISYASPHRILVRGYEQQDVFKLTYSELVYLTIKGELPTPAQKRTLEGVLCSMPDHFFIASHTPAARFTASANPSSPLSAVASAILTAGDHTVSPQHAGQLILSIKDKLEGSELDKLAKEVVEKLMREGKRVPGLGHPWHHRIDPRSQGLKEIAVRNGIWGRIGEFYEVLQKEFENYSGKFLPINIDGMIAIVLSEMEFTPNEMAGIAILAVMPGIIAHVSEEIANSVGLRMVPEELGAKYVGPAERKIDEGWLNDPDRNKL